MVRAPDPAEQGVERALWGALAGDVVVAALLVAAAFGGGSLTMLAEMLRALPLLAVEVFALGLMRAGHRGRLDHFAFGIGKLEAMVWVLVALVRIVATLFVLARVAGALIAAAPAATPLGLALAAVVNAVVLLANFVAMTALKRAARGDGGGALGAQLAVRKGMLIAAAILQVCLTVAAVTEDPGVALALDAAGGTLVAFLMGRGAGRMLARAVPDLLDAPPGADLGEAVRRAAAGAFAPAELLDVRLRRSSRRTFAQVVVDPDAFADAAALAARVAALEAALAAAGEHLDVVVLFAPPAREEAPAEA